MTDEQGSRHEPVVKFAELHRAQELLRGGETIPEELRPAVAEIVTSAAKRLWGSAVFSVAGVGYGVTSVAAGRAVLGLVLSASWLVCGPVQVWASRRIIAAARRRGSARSRATGGHADRQRRRQGAGRPCGHHSSREVSCGSTRIRHDGGEGDRLGQRPQRQVREGEGAGKRPGGRHDRCLATPRPAPVHPSQPDTVAAGPSTTASSSRSGRRARARPPPGQ